MKGLLKALAPTLVNVATTANPLAGMAVKMAANKLGIPADSTLEDVERHVEAHPEKAELLNNTEIELQRLQSNVELYKTEVDDRKNAREHFATDWTPKVFAIITLLSFVAYSFLVTMTPDHDAGIVNLVIGYMGGLLSGISAFFFSSGSENNGKNRKS